LSGRDRRHYVAELRKAEDAYRRQSAAAEAAHGVADRALVAYLLHRKFHERYGPIPPLLLITGCLGACFIRVFWEWEQARASGRKGVKADRRRE
jgi:hypothetical protein